jgi:hypothetical protein
MPAGHASRGVYVVRTPSRLPVPGEREPPLCRPRSRQAGEAAFAAIAERCATSGIEVIPLMPILGDFNDDLRECTREAMVANLARQLGSSDEAVLRKA